MPTPTRIIAHKEFASQRKYSDKALYVQGQGTAPTVGYDYYTWCYIAQVTLDLHHRPLSGKHLADLMEHMPPVGAALPYIPLIIVTTPSRFLSMGRIRITPLADVDATAARVALLAKLKQFVVVLPLFHVSDVHRDADGAVKRGRGSGSAPSPPAKRMRGRSSSGSGADGVVVV